MERELTRSERSLIVVALVEAAQRLEDDVTKLLAGQPELECITGEDAEAPTRWDEKLASATLARAKALKKEANRLVTLADFINNNKHTVTVDCIILITEQA